MVMLASFPDNAGRLRRCKSVSTVNQRPHVPDHVDPWVAQQQALMAATAAHERAHAGVSATRLTNASQVLPRTMSNNSRRSEGSHLAANLRKGSALRYSLDDPPSRHLSRRNTIQNSGSTSKLSSDAVPQRFSDSHGSASGPNLRTKLSFSTLATPTKSISSEPVRSGLRKARSMFYASSRQTTDNNEDTASLTLIDATMGTQPSASEKLIALPPFPVQSTPAIPPEAISKARDECIQGFQRSTGRDRSSVLFTPFKKLQSISSRKSSRTEAGSVSFNSVRSQGTAQAGAEATQSKVIKHKKSRSFSGGFKDKLKKVFRRGSIMPSTELPAQQVEATRSYYYESSKPSDQKSNEHSDNSRSSRYSLHPSRPPTPPFPKESSHMQTGIRHGSGGSEGTATSHSKSRVTSWTDSSNGNTTGTKDGKRLSIIHEVSRPSLKMPVPTRPASKLLNKDAMGGDTNESENVGRFRFSIEPKRVYSALMKEMARKDMDICEVERIDLDENGQVVMSALDRLPYHSGRASIGSDPNELNKMTIRAVTPEELRLSRATSIRGQVRIPTLELPDVHEESSGDDYPVEPADGCSLYAKSHRASSSIGRLQRSQRAMPPTAEQRAARVERASQRWRSTLDDGRRSYEHLSGEGPNLARPDGFLGDGQGPMSTSGSSPGKSEEFVTPKADRVPEERTEEVQEGSRGGKDRSTNCDSPSIYSRNTDSPRSFNIDSVTDLPRALNSQATGSAVIITSHPVSSWTLGTSASGKRLCHSGRSSKDWKAWLSKEVADLEMLAESDITINDQWDVQSKGHRRERTQISEDDVRSESSIAPTCLPKLIRPRLEGKPGSRMNERFPMIDTGRRSSNHSSIKTVGSKREKSPEFASPESHPSVRSAKESTKGSRRGSTRNSTRGSVRGSAKDAFKENAPVKGAISQLPRTARYIAASPRNMVPPHAASTANLLRNFDFSVTPSPGTRERKLGRRISKAKSALELRAQYKGSPGHASIHSQASPNKIARLRAANGSSLEGDTLLMILEGPYHQTKTPSLLKHGENSPMVSKFSETGLDETASVHSRLSSTPGQRLADAFLRQRASGEVIGDETPAFL